MTGKRVALLVVIVLLVALVFAAGGWFSRGLVDARVSMMGFRGDIPRQGFHLLYPHMAMQSGFYGLWQALAALGAVTGTAALILSLAQGSKKQPPAETPSPGEPGPAE
jgi:hypothetical protein